MVPPFGIRLLCLMYGRTRYSGYFTILLLLWFYVIFHQSSSFLVKIGRTFLLNNIFFLLMKKEKSPGSGLSRFGKCSNETYFFELFQSNLFDYLMYSKILHHCAMIKTQAYIKVEKHWSGTS